MPPAARTRPLPYGFFVCGVMSMCFSAFVLWELAHALMGEASGSDVTFRGAYLLLGSLGLITTEALWMDRHEAYAASVALAACFALIVIGSSIMLGDLAFGVVVLAVSALPVGPMLAYIRVRSRQLWPRAGVGVPAPRP